MCQFPGNNVHVVWEENFVRRRLISSIRRSTNGGATFGDNCINLSENAGSSLSSPG